MTTFYVQPNSTIRDFYAETNEGDVTEIRIDWSAVADVEGTSVSSVAWSVDAGNASVSSTALASNVASALLTTTDRARSRTKITATMADSQKSVVFLHVLTNGYTDAGDYW